MPNFRSIYRTQAAKYERLVAREDFRGNIWSTLRQLAPWSGSRVVELGAGTGRLTRLLAPRTKHIGFFDQSAHMLRMAIDKLKASGIENWAAAVADNRALPLKAGSADIAIAGWSLGHSVDWYPEHWQLEIGKALSEMRRVVCPGGTIIILETLGTGQESPRPPTPGLEAYYSWLQQDHGFSTTWIRTDYRFASSREAFALLSFFFGEEMAQRATVSAGTIVPECTGLWWRGID